MTGGLWWARLGCYRRAVWSCSRGLCVAAVAPDPGFPAHWLLHGQAVCAMVSRAACQCRGQPAQGCCGGNGEPLEAQGAGGVARTLPGSRGFLLQQGRSWEGGCSMADGLSTKGFCCVFSLGREYAEGGAGQVQFGGGWIRLVLKDGV